MEGVEDISLSPDGGSVAFIVPGKGRGNALYTVSTSGGATPKRVLVASGAPERLHYCGWVSNDRLLCNVYMLRADIFSPVAMSRLVAVDAEGGNVKVVSRRDSPDAIRKTHFGGEVVDWLPDQEGSVLLGRYYVPEERIGSNVASRHDGYGVDRVDTRTLQFKRVEQPRASTVEYITDGTGNVRIMGQAEVSGTGYATGRTKYFYRRSGSRSWEPLSEYNVLTRQGFNPYAVDPKLNVAYGFKRINGFQALYQVDLSGSLAEGPVAVHPAVDVDGLIQLGRSKRVVGASFATEKRQAVYFDPEIKKLAAALGKALPGSPLIHISGASADEQKLLVWAGSDVDPGR